jgi:hypothetical protein
MLGIPASRESSAYELPPEIVVSDNQPGPRPPCGVEPIPAYPAMNGEPVVKSWHESELGQAWKPPECAHWTEAGFTSIITVSARFSSSNESSRLLGHLGAISERVGMRYWSTTHKRWQTLIVEAHALTNAQGGQRRADFTAEEMKAGDTVYFEQEDNLSGKATYRMRILESSASRIVFSVENVSTIRYALLTVMHPGDMQSLYSLDREAEGVWRYYGMVRTGVNANKKIAANEASGINRAVAFYRFLAGIPTDREPPAAR